ncbi:hypothetical protein M1P56_01960 [Streptomyces sp. HU2014]|uniref:Uncharacterized protein n=1 Tax=Streptomyces albireticuli TaxID=1940 RepID=A0A1Z2L5P6_9ACTN|nr:MULTISPECIES: hypothetical protein [Streptomyces]ARZ69615.1 hypothetical protein SMD11_4001 [Streptomyces albireticuli]UQI43235.1 hypothetical protein M1P56_01960 [Streptomyces sp. HU2014]
MECFRLTLTRVTAVRDGRWEDAFTSVESEKRHRQETHPGTERAGHPEEHAMSHQPITRYAQGGGHGRPDDDGDGLPGQPWTPTDEPTPDGSTPPGGGTHGK